MIMNIISLRPGPPLLLFLDYDGTLVDFRDVPPRAILSPSRRTLLRRLARKNWVCIVTGRSLAEIRRLVGLRDMAYIGNHGLEMQWDRRTWIHPRALGLRPALRDVLGRIEHRSRRIPGRRVEDKGLTASVHFRQMSPAARTRMRQILQAEMRAASQTFRLVAGKKVWEIRPRVSWDKGKAVSEIRRWLGTEKRALPVYIGDDRTDEDAFRELRADGLTFRVGGGKTQALGRLRDVAAVWRFLGALK